MNKKKQVFLSIPEAAQLLGISRIAVYRQVKKGKIKARRIGRNYVISKRDLGYSITDKHKQMIEKAVQKAFKEYGEVLRRLKDE